MGRTFKVPKNCDDGNVAAVKETRLIVLEEHGLLNGESESSKIEDIAANNHVKKLTLKKYE